MIFVNKKSPADICSAGSFYILYQKEDPKAKGEEKPEEELMGKRKSSPRLATTSRLDVVTISMVQKRKHYTLKMEKRDVEH